MTDNSFRRVEYHGRSDLSIGWQRNRCVEFLQKASVEGIGSINDAIEAHQCYLMVRDVPELFDADVLEHAGEVTKKFFTEACRYVGNGMSTDGLLSLYEQVSFQYRTRFWDLLRDSRAVESMDSAALIDLLKSDAECLGPILENPRLVDSFAEIIKDALIANPVISAELIIGRTALDQYSKKSLSLPKGLGNVEIDGIMLDYMSCEGANSNYTDALLAWPAKARGTYSPSPEVCVMAKRKHEESEAEVLRDGISIRWAIGVTIDMNQEACKGIVLKRDGLETIHVFGGRWLERYTSYADILNNLIYIFDIIGANKLLLMSAYKNESDGIISLFGPHVVDEYRETLGFQIRNKTAVLEVTAYAGFLDSRGLRLEDALEWAYNSHFEEMFGIRGFQLALPTQRASWFDKCKGIGSEIERAIKTYLIFAQRGEIDLDYLGYTRFKTFSDVPALQKKKYAIAGSHFNEAGYLLFSDQCMLAYSPDDDSDETSFFNRMLNHRVSRQDYEDYLQSDIDRLLDSGYLVDDDRFLPTVDAVCLKRVWDYDALPLRGLEQDKLEAVRRLVDKDVLEYSDELFSPAEAAYLNYMYNDSSFSNSWGLRNKYSHASMSIDDPNEKRIKGDYYCMLTLLIEITLKIYFELVDSTESTGHITTRVCIELRDTAANCRSCFAS